MGKKNILARYALFIFGLYIMAIGIVLIVKCALGTTPIASLNYVLSVNTSLSLGVWTFIFNVVLIIAQLFLLGKCISSKDKLEILLQIPLSFVFSFFLDLNMLLFEELRPTRYAVCLVWLLSGCLIQSLGMSLALKPRVALLSADAVVRYVSERYKQKFSLCKIAFDIVLVTLAVITSILFTRTVQGVREGSLIAACINGFIVSFLSTKVITRRNIRRIRQLVLSPFNIKLSNW